MSTCFTFTSISANIIVIFPLLITAGEDFHALTQTLDFYSDESLVDVNITIINDELRESNETFVIFLRGVTGVELSPHAYTEVIIYDDDDVKANVSNDVKGIAVFLFILSNVVYAYST